MLKLCAREQKRTGAAFLTTARELWNAELLRNEPSITSITDRITKFKRDCDNMSFLQALANVKEFKQFGRTPLASVADMREWLPRHSMTDYAVLKQRLRELKNERGTAGKLSKNTISLYQHKIRDIQNRAVPAKERQAVVPKKSRLRETAAAKLRARSDQDKETRVVPANGGQCGPQPMCPVCWETPTDPVRLQCDHELCKACMRRWAQGGGKGPGLGAGAKCPVCRKVSNRRRLWEDPDDRRPKRRHTNAASAAPGGSRATSVHAPVAMQG